MIDQAETRQVPQSWEQLTQRDAQTKGQLIQVEKEGIASGDFNKSWARMADIDDRGLTRNVPVDRSGVNTYTSWSWETLSKWPQPSAGCNSTHLNG